MPSKTCRRVCFTSYDMTMYKRIPFLLEAYPEKVRYVVVQGEACPETERHHLQGYIEFKKKMRYPAVKDLLGDEKMHLEPAKASAVKNREYCTKSESSLPEFPPLELGTAAKSKQGKRTDLEVPISKILEGQSLAEVSEQCPKAYVKFHRGLKALRLQQHRKKLNQFNAKMTVDVLWGQPGAGKNRFIYQKHGPENCFSPIWNGSKWWFDGYAGQKVLVIDEFYGQCRTSVLQQLLDKYTRLWEVKGDFELGTWDQIYITSNCHPSEWYNSWENIPEKVMQSIIRRISTVTYMERPPEAKKLSWDSIPEMNMEPTRQTTLPEILEPDQEPGTSGGSVLPATSGTAQLLQIPAKEPKAITCTTHFRNPAFLFTGPPKNADSQICPETQTIQKQEVEGEGDVPVQKDQCGC